MTRRTAGTGSVYRPTYPGPDGKPRTSAIWWVAYAWRNERIRESSGTRSKKVAETFLRDRLTARDAGRPGGKLARNTTLATLRDLVVADYAAQGRRSRVGQRFDRLEEILGPGTPATEINEAVVTDYIARRRKGGRKNATINRELSALKRGFRLAMRAKLVGSQPDFSLLLEDNARQGFLEEAQLRSILGHLPEPFRPVVLTAYLTGWRVASELLTRQWRHVDLETRWLRLEPGEGKSRKGRMFPVVGELLEVLRAQRAVTDALEAQGRIVPWVFHRDGDRIGHHALRLAWGRARVAAGLPGKLLHDLRRTAVRDLERAGVSRSAAMKMVGHETEAIYRRYAIVDEATLREAGERLAHGRSGAQVKAESK